jgi:hypothetical protein
MARQADDRKTLQVAGRSVPLVIVRHPRARHMSLRLESAGAGLRLTLPRRASLSEGLAFAESKSEWIRRQLAAQPARVPFVPGSIVPVLGREHVIRHAPWARRGVWREHGVLWASGLAEHLPRRVTDYLKGEARREITARAQDKARTIEREVRRVTLRDMTSRWGSCGDGRLAFSWRLILAPETVLDYVVAHEVAHLRYMSHGPRFWALTARLTEDVAGPTRWLKTQGDRLLAYG